MKIVNINISKVAVAVMAICALFLCSCAKPEPAVLVEVSAQYSEVPAQKGSMFVNVKCAGEWTLRLEKAGAVVDWAELSKTAGSGNSSTVRLEYDENTSQQHRTLTIIATSASQWGSCTVTQLGSGSKPGTGGGQNSGGQGSGDENQDAGSDGSSDGQDDGSDGSGDGQNDGSGSQSPGGSAGVDLKKVSWLELPKMDDPELDYYAHWFTYNGTRYRNYSFGYSKKDYVSIWVAYPLCKNPYLNGSSSGGGDDWAPNPLFDAGIQPDYSRSFGYSSGYERGHQIANADRKCSNEANRQTFYFTNSTLQHKNFNGPVWGVLENNMREAAKTADTLYVVTGCVIPESPSYIRDSHDHNVPIPSGYFKAALRYHKASTHAVWLGAAFYLEHDASKYPSKLITSAESMSIAELEKKLGMNFFVNLPDKIGADQATAVESQNPDTYSSIWGIR